MSIKNEIKLSGTEDKLTISVDVPDRKYFKEVELPAKVDTEKATSEYKNGVLDITVPKLKEKKTKSKDIKNRVTENQNLRLYFFFFYFFVKLKEST